MDPYIDGAPLGSSPFVCFESQVPINDPLSLESGKFCDSGMKSFGEESLFQQLAPFLEPTSKKKLYKACKTFRCRIIGGRPWSLLLRFAMEQVNEDEETLLSKLKFLSRFSSPGPLYTCSLYNRNTFGRYMRELTRSLLDGFNLHQRPPGPSVLHSRYVDNQRNLESEARQSGDMSLPSYVTATWHPSLHNVGILRVTQAQYELALNYVQLREQYRRSFLPR